jgi:hypothetical protein
VNGSRGHSSRSGRKPYRGSHQSMVNSYQDRERKVLPGEFREKSGNQRAPDEVQDFLDANGAKRANPTACRKHSIAARVLECWCLRPRTRNSIWQRSTNGGARVCRWHGHGSIRSRFAPFAAPELSKLARGAPSRIPRRTKKKRQCPLHQGIAAPIPTVSTLRSEFADSYGLWTDS